MKTDFIQKVFYTAKMLYREYKESQNECKKRKDYYLPYCEELISEASDYEKKVSSNSNEQSDFEYSIKYLNQANRDPDYPSLRYLFDSDLKPGKLYNEIPRENGEENNYTACYYDESKKIIRRVYNNCIRPLECLYYYTYNSRTEIDIEYDGNKWNVIGLSKVEYDDFGRLSEIKKLDLAGSDSAEKVNKLWKKGKMLSIINVSIEKYHYENDSLVGFNIYNCSHALPILKNYRIKEMDWNISEISICIERDNEGNPNNYKKNWNEWWFEIRNSEEVHPLSKKQISGLCRFEKQRSLLLEKKDVDTDQKDLTMISSCESGNNTNENLLKYLQNRISINSDLKTIVELFEQMCSITVGDDLILFETGTFAFDEEEKFYFSIVRQFPDDNEYYQVHVNVLYESTNENKHFQQVVWSDAIEGNIFDYIKKSPEFNRCKDERIYDLRLFTDIY